MDAKSLNSSENSCGEVRKISSGINYVFRKGSVAPNFTISDQEKEEAQRERKIKLLDGSELKCYPLPQTMPEVDNTMQLDTTGTYFIIGRNRAKKQAQKTADEQRAEMEEKAEERLFLDNAFFLLANYRRILSDSRMFLCPVPIQSGLAYTGTSGFHCPTLGVYIEWWMNCGASMFANKKGTKWLVYHIAGSPLSGSNSCGVVNEQGETMSWQIVPFKDLWPSFIEINSRYDYAKNNYEAYTLKQVIDSLRSETADDSNAVEVMFLRNDNDKLRLCVDSLREQIESLTNKLHQVLLCYKHNELKRFLQEYYELKEKTDKQVFEIQQERIRMRKLLRSNEITNVEYQRKWSPLKQAKEKAIYNFDDFVRSSLFALFPEDRITLDEIMDFVNNDNIK